MITEEMDGDKALDELSEELLRTSSEYELNMLWERYDELSEELLSPEQQLTFLRTIQQQNHLEVEAKGRLITLLVGEQRRLMASGVDTEKLDSISKEYEQLLGME